MNLHKHVWTEALQMEDFRDEGGRNEERLKRLVGLAEGYEKRVKEETELTKEQLKTRYVGKVDPKKRKILLFWSKILTIITDNIKRSGRRRSATDRRQYCFRLAANDRQGSFGGEIERRYEWASSAEWVDGCRR